MGKIDFVKGLMIHRFDSLAKVVVSVLLSLSYFLPLKGIKGFVNARFRKWTDTLRTRDVRPVSFAARACVRPHG